VQGIHRLRTDPRRLQLHTSNYQTPPISSMTIKYIGDLERAMTTSNLIMNRGMNHMTVVDLVHTFLIFLVNIHAGVMSWYRRWKS